MTLMELPTGIVYHIASYLSLEHDISSLARTNRQLHYLLDRILYKRNIRHSGSSALEWACAHRWEPLTGKMLELGSQPDAYVNEPWKPLANAAKHDYESIVRRFLEKGVDPDPTWQWANIDHFDFDDEEINPPRCPLILAAQNGQESVVRVLLDRAIQLKGSRPPDGGAVETAVAYEQEDMLQYLLDVRANIGFYRTS